MTHHLVGVTEIAEMLGLSRQRADQLTRQYEDFPPAEAVLASGRVWSRVAVQHWIKAHRERRPGRRKAKK